MSTARSIAHNLLPPIVVKTARAAAAIGRGPGVRDWEYLPGGWPDEGQGMRGWNAESVLATQLERWPAFVQSTQGTAPFGLSHESAVTNTDYAVHNTVMSFGYVLARAARGRKKLSILDWGGGIGHYCIYARALMPELELDYSCRELPLLADGGRKVLPEATFYTSEKEALARRYDLIVASSSLHYARDWQAVLAGLAGACDGHLYITRQPCVQHAPSYVVVQRPYQHGYQTEYPGWFLNQPEFLAYSAGLGLALLREFLIDERPAVPNAPEQADYRGFLFAAPRRIEGGHGRPRR
jgi:putative methyltransferase (TIGR04325 family)